MDIETGTSLYVLLVVVDLCVLLFNHQSSETK